MTIPTEIIAGDSLSFEFSSSEYPADSWTGTIKLINETNAYSVASTDNGNGVHLFEETAANTAAWVKGSYSYHIVMTAGGIRKTLQNGTIKILPDPADGPYDVRSDVKKTLDYLDAAINKVANDAILDYQIGNRQIRRIPPGDLMQLHIKYTAMYRKELRDEALANGVPQSSKIKVRFR